MKLSIFIFFMTSCFANINTISLLGNIQQKFEKIINFKAEITEIIDNNKFEGILFYKKPNKLKITYTQPFSQVLISDGEYMWLYIEKNKQIIKRKLSFQDKVCLAGRFIANIEEFKTIYDFFLIQEDTKNYHLNLKLKKDKKEYPKELDLFVDKKKFITTKLIIKNNIGNETVISLKNISTNTKISDKIFKMEILEGVSVIEY